MDITKNKKNVHMAAKKIWGFVKKQKKTKYGWRLRCFFCIFSDWMQREKVSEYRWSDFLFFRMEHHSANQYDYVFS